MISVGQKLTERGFRRGIAIGRAEDVLRILTARGVAVDEESRKLVLECRDLAILDKWFDKALTATRFSDLLARR